MVNRPKNKIAYDCISDQPIPLGHLVVSADQPILHPDVGYSQRIVAFVATEHERPHGVVISEPRPGEYNVLIQGKIDILVSPPTFEAPDDLKIEIKRASKNGSS